MSPPLSRTKVFVSYSHADKKWLERLQRHLKPLARKGLECWDDTHIKPGDDWQNEIWAALDTAKVAVLLISADFFASDFIDEKELPPLLTGAQQKGVLVLPVIVSASRFARDPRLGQIQAINSPDNPLNVMPEGEQETVLERLAQSIESALHYPGTSPPPLAKGSATLVADIVEWYHLDKKHFVERFFDFLDATGADDVNVSLRVSAPDLDALINHIRGQSARASDPDIILDQRSAITNTTEYISSVERIGSMLICSTLRDFSRRDTLICLERFLALCLAHCTARLGRWQLASEPPVYPHRWFDYGHPAEVCQFIYNCSAVTDTVIAADENAKPHVTVYVPLGKLENTGGPGGSFITGIYESCSYIPPMIWLEYILPQMGYMQTLLEGAYFQISQLESIYCTEGKVFRGSSFQEADEQIPGTRHWVVPRE